MCTTETRSLFILFLRFQLAAVLKYGHLRSCPTVWSEAYAKHTTALKVLSCGTVSGMLRVKCLASVKVSFGKEMLAMERV